MKTKTTLVVIDNVVVGFIVSVVVWILLFFGRRYAEKTEDLLRSSHSNDFETLTLSYSYQIRMTTTFDTTRQQFRRILQSTNCNNCDSKKRLGAEYFDEWKEGNRVGVWFCKYMFWTNGISTTTATNGRRNNRPSQ